MEFRFLALAPAKKCSAQDSRGVRSAGDQLPVSRGLAGAGARETIYYAHPAFACILQLLVKREHLTPVAQRKPAMAVFGLAATRQNAYKKLASLAGMLHDLGIEKILDIGPEFAAPARTEWNSGETRGGACGARILPANSHRRCWGFCRMIHFPWQNPDSRWLLCAGNDSRAGIGLSGRN